MKYKDLADGSLFQYSPAPGTHETAFKAQGKAYLLRSGEAVTLHANRNVDDLPKLTGDGYRLGVRKSGALVIFSQANEGYYFVHDFLIIGHDRVRQDDVKPIVGKLELREQQELVDIILRKIEQNAADNEHLLHVLRRGLFQDFSQIKLT